MKSKDLKIRASSAGKLMTDAPGVGLTENQEAQLEEYKQRQAGTLLDSRGKTLKLTAKMAEAMAELQARKDAPFELSQTAKTYVTELWLYHKYGYRAPVVTPELQKGLLCEQDAIALVSELLPEKEFRVKNRTPYEDAYNTGNPDAVLRRTGVVEDYKCPFTLKQFIDAEPGNDYEGQAQVYMHLTGLHTFRLCYCLVDTPEELVFQLMKKYYYKFGQDEGNPEYEEIVRINEG